MPITNLIAASPARRWGNRTPAPAPLAWELLTVADHQRVVPTAANTTATDSASPITADYIPYKAWQSPFLAADGKLYYFGGLHSDYPGNDVDVCDLAALGSGTAMVWEQLAHPRVPPAGDEGYGTSGTSSLWKNYGTPLADKLDWQPYTAHYYCGAMVHPDFGVLRKAPYPVNPGTGIYSTSTWGGDGYPVSSLTYWEGYDARSHGIVAYNTATDRYSLHCPGAGAIQWADLSNYAPTIDGFLVLSQHAESTVTVMEVSAATSQLMAVKWALAQADTGVRGNQSNAGEGTLIRWMEDTRFAFLHKQGDTNLQGLWIYDHAAGLPAASRFTAVALPAGITLVAGGNLNAAVDRDARRLFIAVYRASAAPLIYTSSFDAPSAWTLLAGNTDSALAFAQYTNTAAPGREAMFYWGGYLYIIEIYSSNSRVRWWRTPV